MPTAPLQNWCLDSSRLDERFPYTGCFFNCSHQKNSKCKNKPKYTNCSHGNSSEMSKYGKSKNIVTVPHC